jgi:hypothetical protein
MYDSELTLRDALTQAVDLQTAPITIRNVETLRGTIIDSLIQTAVFSSDVAVKKLAREYIRTIATACGAVPSSIAPVYHAIGAQNISGFTVPAMNIRALTYDFAQIIFQTALEKQVGVFIFEIARSEMQYTFQDPDEFACVILAAAIKTGYAGPIFIQGDHYQISKKRFVENAEEELQSLERLIKQSITAGFYNIDIDASTLVDLAKPTVAQQQAENIRATTACVKMIQACSSPTRISIGAEIGHIGDKTSTKEDFSAFMEGLRQEHIADALTKISVQTGTQHGGNILPDGSVAQMPIDFTVLTDIGTLARERYSLGGAVQHGASTLPLSLFPHFVTTRTLEVHLSTAFQNLIFEHLPQSLHTQMNQWVYDTCTDERKPEWSDEQFLYRLRKKSLGPFKQQLWSLTSEELQPIKTALKTYVSELFMLLAVHNTKQIVQKLVTV